MECTLSTSDPLLTRSIIMAALEDPRRTLGVIVGKGQPSSWQLAQLSLSGEVANAIIESASSWLTSLSTSDLIEYQIGNFYVSDSDASYLHITDLGESGALINNLARLSLIPDVDDELLHHAEFLVSVIKTPHNQIFLFKRLTPKFVLGRTSGFKLVRTGGSFDLLTETVIQFSGSYDCVVVNDQVFITHRNNFEKLFDFGVLKVESARTVLHELCSVVPFTDPQAFVSSCLSDTRLHKKVQSVLLRGLYKSFDLARIEEIVTDRGLPVQFVQDDDGNRSIVFDGSSLSRRAILSLLDDDHVRSILTGTDYEATSKRNMPPRVAP